MSSHSFLLSSRLIDVMAAGTGSGVGVGGVGVGEWGLYWQLAIALGPSSVEAEGLVR